MKTIVKTENNGEVFLTDAPDVDFEELNEQKAQEIKIKFAAEQSEGIQEPTVNVASVFNKFRDMQFTATETVFDHNYSEAESQGGSVKQRLEALELPAARLQRLQEELDALEAELKMLEREET